MKLLSEQIKETAGQLRQDFNKLSFDVRNECTPALEELYDSLGSILGRSSLVAELDKMELASRCCDETEKVIVSHLSKVLRIISTHQCCDDPRNYRLLSNALDSLVRDMQHDGPVHMSPPPPDAMKRPVLTIKSSVLDIFFGKSKSILPLTDDFLCVLNRYGRWEEKTPELENDPTLRQVIPYILLKDEQRYLYYERSGNETRLHQLLSIGFGGHVEREDFFCCNSASVYNAAQRELAEECGLLTTTQSFAPLHIIRDSTDQVSSVHLGLVFLVDLVALNPETFDGLAYSDEVRNPEWCTKQRLASEPTLHHLETWSKLILPLLP